MESLGPYKLEGELGRGAMGVVFRAFDPAIGRRVAIKVIQFNQFASPEEQAELKLRFAREAAAAGRLSHPNIVTIYQFGEEGSLQYLVQELVEGGSLAQLLRQPLEPKRALAILTHVAEGLDYAHARGVVHRDVKPGNILIDLTGRAKLTDFGIARVASQTITGSDAVLGTPAYMAPEQIQGLKLDGRCDQFALAVVAYQVLAGRRPFAADNHTALVYQILHGHPDPIHLINPALPSAMSEVAARALGKSPAGRFSTCAEFAAALGASLENRPTPARRKPLPDSPMLLEAPHFLPRTESATSRAWVWLTLALLIAAAIALQRQWPRGIEEHLKQPPSGKVPATTGSLANAAPRTKQKTSSPKRSPSNPEAERQVPAVLPPKAEPINVESKTIENTPIQQGTTPPAPSRPAVGFADIYFEPGVTTIGRDGLATLARVAKGLNEFFETFRDDVIYIDGHADESEGTVDECAILAKGRAVAVQQTLENLRVPASKIRAISNGMQQPQCTERTAECKQKNRRVHFRMRQ